MDNPIIQAESNYYYHGLTLEIPLPSSLSTLRNVTLLKLVHSDFPDSSLRRCAGSRKPEIPPLLAFLCLEEPDGLWNLEILSALHPPGQSWKPEAGNWRKSSQPQNGQAQMLAGSWKLEIPLRSGSRRRKLETGNSTPDILNEISQIKSSAV